MGFFSKIASGVKSFVKKGASEVESFASKAGGALHAVNNVMDKVASSSIGKAVLDAIPEGHAVYDTIRGGTGALERTAHSVKDLAGGVKNLTGAKDLQSAVKDGQSLVRQGKSIAGQAGRDFRQTKSELERTTRPLRQEMSNRMRSGSRVQVGAMDTGGAMMPRKRKHRKKRKN